jgi:uncharacterized protein (DUF1330 family)
MNDLNGDNAGLTSMLEGDPNEPICMLNLLRYREMAEEGRGVDGLTGRGAYEKYGKLFAALSPRYGGSPMWMGKALNTIIGAEDWDIVILVKYPARQNFIDMMLDRDYQAIAVFRAAALADSRLIEMNEILHNA